MQFVRALIPLLLFSIFVSAATPAADQPQENLSKRELRLGKVVIKVPVASTPQQRAIGLMHRATLGHNEGMLFVFDFPQQVAFWMKNTLVPLSVAYINSTGTILEIYDMEPLNEESVPSTSTAVLYALEMPKGWFEQNGMKPGTVVEGLPEVERYKSL
ncbi:MAG: hypothetical protein C5B47_08465 [Verrucomicrobia bacterium]|nr:MAG: hypothetical protein C5B47_08465 [Verrucomicrobiota bacterium]